MGNRLTNRFNCEQIAQGTLTNFDKFGIVKKNYFKYQMPVLKVEIIHINYSVVDNYSIILQNFNIYATKSCIF